LLLYEISKGLEAFIFRYYKFGIRRGEIHVGHEQTAPE
jgi:hypothetical protein